jgi:hypothetical protein
VRDSRRRTRFRVLVVAVRRRRLQVRATSVRPRSAACSSLDHVGEFSGCRDVDPVSFGAVDDWSGDRVEFWRASGCHVLLHRAAHAVGCCCGECPQRLCVDAGALRARDSERLVLRASVSRVAADIAEWGIERGCRECKRREECQFLPEQRWLVVSDPRLDAGLLEFGRECVCPRELDSQKRGALPDLPAVGPFGFDTDRSGDDVRVAPA